jgi:hypothetical protein
VPTTVQTLTTELGKIVATLNNVTQLGAGAKGMVNALGWALPPGLDDIGLSALDFPCSWKIARSGRVDEASSTTSWSWRRVAEPASRPPSW